MNLASNLQRWATRTPSHPAILFEARTWTYAELAADIAELRALLPKSVLVVAKIEKDSALENIESILRASDVVMVARGDLGVELPFEEVPIAQKKITPIPGRRVESGDGAMRDVSVGRPTLGRMDL